MADSRRAQRFQISLDEARMFSLWKFAFKRGQSPARFGRDLLVERLDTLIRQDGGPKSSPVAEREQDPNVN